MTAVVWFGVFLALWRVGGVALADRRNIAIIIC
jgi:hypothetical protein